MNFGKKSAILDEMTCVKQKNKIELNTKRINVVFLDEYVIN